MSTLTRARRLVIGCLLVASTDAAAQQAFTDSAIIPGVTPIKDVHITELRTRIDALRQRANLSGFAWTDPVITPGVTPVRAVHTEELRTAVSVVPPVIGQPAPSFSEAIAVGGIVKASHLTELRGVVLALEACPITMSTAGVAATAASTTAPGR